MVLLCGVLHCGTILARFGNVETRRGNWWIKYHWCGSALENRPASVGQNVAAAQAESS